MELSERQKNHIQMLIKANLPLNDIAECLEIPLSVLLSQYEDSTSKGTKGQKKSEEMIVDVTIGNLIYCVHLHHEATLLDLEQKIKLLKNVPRDFQLMINKKIQSKKDIQLCSLKGWEQKVEVLEVEVKEKTLEKEKQYAMGTHKVPEEPSSLISFKEKKAHTFLNQPGIEGKESFSVWIRNPSNSEKFQNRLEDLGLLTGFTIKNEQMIEAPESLFDIDPDLLQKSINANVAMRTQSTWTSSQKIVDLYTVGFWEGTWSKNWINVGVNVGGGRSTSEKENNDEEGDYFYVRTLCPRIIVDLRKCRGALTKKASEYLKQKPWEDQEKTAKFRNTFGREVVVRVELGGLFYYTRKTTKKDVKMKKQYQHDLEVHLSTVLLGNADLRHGSQETNKQGELKQEEISNIFCKGGDEFVWSLENVTPWKDSLNDPMLWKILNIVESVPIEEFLREELIDKFEFPKDLSWQATEPFESKETLKIKILREENEQLRQEIKKLTEDSSSKTKTLREENEKLRQEIKSLTQAALIGMAFQ